MCSNVVIKELTVPAWTVGWNQTLVVQVSVIQVWGQHLNYLATDYQVNKLLTETC